MFITNNIIYSPNNKKNILLIDTTLFDTNYFDEFSYKFIIVENFYNDPDVLRNFALDSYDYSDKRPYGSRTLARYLNEAINDKINYYLNNVFSKFCCDFNKNKDCGSFLFSKEYINKLWIHRDDSHNTSQSGVIYLNPIKNVNSGTAFFIKNNNGLNKTFLKQQEWDNYVNNDNFLICDKIGYKYNKFLLYDANIYHTIYKHFGTNKINCRLTQTFFIKCD